MSRGGAIHWIKEIDRMRSPVWATTYCGKIGSDDGADEWTTFDGHEMRFEARLKLRGVTCKRCLLSAKNRMQQA